MKPRLLIVDDDDDVRCLFRMALERDFEVIEAASGVQALARAQDATPALILLDLMLPDIDGLEVYRRLHADDRTNTIPVIFVSARADLLNYAAALQLGTEHFLGKPVGLHDLKQRIQAVMAQHTVCLIASDYRPVLADAP